MNASKTASSSKDSPTHTEIEAAELEERAYLQWATRVIDSGWHRECRSRRCRRHGCQQIARCELQQRDRLHRLLTELSLAEIELDTADKKMRRGPAAAKRNALLADAHARGWLPLPGYIP